MVAVRSFSILLAFRSPLIPIGIPAKKSKVIPTKPMSSSNLKTKLEFKMFVGVMHQQIIKGMNTANANSNPKIPISVRVVLFFTPIDTFFYVLDLEIQLAGLKILALTEGCFPLCRRYAAGQEALRA